MVYAAAPLALFALRLAVVAPVLVLAVGWPKPPRRDHLADFLSQFTENEALVRSHFGPGFCSTGGEKPCLSATRRILPSEEGGLKIQWPDIWPFNDDDLEREDFAKDAHFYRGVDFTHHVDRTAGKQLTAFYRDVATSRDDKIDLLIDLGTSWTSHLPKGYPAKKVFGVGMNRKEMHDNEELTHFWVRDLNQEPTIKISDGTVDVFTMAMSIEYFNKPLQLFGDMRRALLPGGVAVVSFSEHYFGSKVIRCWRKASHLQRVAIVMSHLHFAGFARIAAYEVVVDEDNVHDHDDPMYIVLGYAPEESWRDEL